MIRPVLFVDLPGIIYALNRRVSGKQQTSFAGSNRRRTTSPHHLF